MDRTPTTGDIIRLSGDLYRVEAFRDCTPSGRIIPLEAENKGFGWTAIYANFVMKQIAKMTDDNLAAFFSRPEFN